MLWPGLVRRFPVLAIRDFRLLLADRVLAPAAAAFSLVGVAFAVLDLTGSTADLSYVLAAQILPALVFALAGGVVADRIAPQKVIIAANAMMAVGEGTFGILVLTGHPALWEMIALEGLIVSIQTTRLLLFEFFIRFLTGAGREFKPLPPPLTTQTAIAEPNLRGPV